MPERDDPDFARRSAAAKKGWHTRRGNQVSSSVGEPMTESHSRVLGLSSQTLGQLREATTPNSADTLENSHLWRRLGDSTRDLKNFNHSRMLEIAHWLGIHNGIAKRFLQILTDFVVGTEPVPSADDSELLNEWLLAFWDDPVNDMRTFSRELCSQLAQYGEQFVTLHVRTTDGRLQLGYLDPSGVQDVVFDPDNARRPCEVVCGGKVGWQPIVYRIFLFGEDLDDVFLPSGTAANGGGAFKLRPRSTEILRARREAAGVRAEDAEVTEYSGLLVMRQINRASNQKRGISDLFAPADHLDGYDKYLYQMVERAYLLNLILVDLVVEGATEEGQLQEQIKFVQQALTDPNGIYAHNESVQASMHTPDLKSADHAGMGRMIKNHILGTWGFPEAWFAEGGETNLATLAEQGSPTIKMLESRQTYMKSLLWGVAHLAMQLKLRAAPELEKKLRASMDLKNSEDWDLADALQDFTVRMGMITGKDSMREAQTMVQHTTAVASAEEAGYVSHATAARIWQKLASEVFDVEMEEADRDLLEAGGAVDLGAEIEARPGMPEPGMESRPDERDTLLGEPGPVGVGTARTDLQPVGDADARAMQSFNELTLAIERAWKTSDQMLIDALRNELFKRLGMKKPDVLDVPEPSQGGGGGRPF